MHACTHQHAKAPWIHPHAPGTKTGWPSYVNTCHSASASSMFSTSLNPVCATDVSTCTPAAAPRSVPHSTAMAIPETSPGSRHTHRFPQRQPGARGSCAHDNPLPSSRHPRAPGADQATHSPFRRASRTRPPPLRVPRWLRPCGPRAGPAPRCRRGQGPGRSRPLRRVVSCLDWRESPRPRAKEVGGPAPSCLPGNRAKSCIRPWPAWPGTPRPQPDMTGRKQAHQVGAGVRSSSSKSGPAM